LKYARLNDFSISLLSNGTKLTDQLLKSLVDNNIGLVQISLYSLDALIHDFITQRKGSFNQTMQNINRLLEAKVPLIIACPVMKPNLNSLKDLIIWGEKNRIHVNPDVVIKARSDFNDDNLNHRLDAEEIKTAIKIITDFSPTYQKSLLSKDVNKKYSASDPICGIGTTSLCISYDGSFYPCPGMRYNVGDYNTNSVSNVWSNSPQLKELRQLRLSSYSKCVKCPSIDYCVLCPAKFYNESKGDYLTITSHFCSVASINKQIAEEYVRNSVKLHDVNC
jgi:radical SAM protein with 4Fe4S-binding SPASM domain